MIESKKIKANILGMIVKESNVYHGRNECIFFGRSGSAIKWWIRDQFGKTDDLVYITGDIDNSVRPDCEALITDQQLTITLLKWHD
jgi:hypothetical protein